MSGDSTAGAAKLSEIALAFNFVSGALEVLPGPALRERIGHAATGPTD